MKTDTLARRLRYEPPNPEQRPRDASQRLFPTDADSLVFEAIDRHGPLPTPYLFEFQKHLRPSYHHFQYRLRDLFHGDAGGSYLTRPPAQFAAYEARYQHLVYNLAPRAKRFLEQRGTLSPFSARRFDPFVHQLMAACVTSSIALEAQSFNARFIDMDEIISRSTCPQKTRNSVNPLAVSVGPRKLIPDALFGVEYLGRGFRFFALEVDRNTESIQSQLADSTTFSKKIAAYGTVLRDRLYNAQWGLPNLSIITVTTNSRHALNMNKYLRDAEERVYEDRFLFRCEPTFGENWRVPKTPLRDIFGTTLRPDRAPVEVSPSAEPTNRLSI